MLAGLFSNTITCVAWATSEQASKQHQQMYTYVCIVAPAGHTCAWWQPSSSSTCMNGTVLMLQRSGVPVAVAPHAGRHYSPTDHPSQQQTLRCGAAAFTACAAVRPPGPPPTIATSVESLCMLVQYGCCVSRTEAISLHIRADVKTCALVAYSLVPLQLHCLPTSCFRFDQSLQ
jgi:hypothetical protein